MCTVIFLPVKDRIYIGSLRDEKPTRPAALAPKLYVDKELTYLAPKDSFAMGTWVGITETGSVLVLLNGGFKAHQTTFKYRKSRGLIVTELLTSIMPVTDWKLMNLKDIEPFTLIVWSYNTLFELVWDGMKKHTKHLSSIQTYLWSSSTLYDCEASNRRKNLFEKWLSTNPSISMNTLLDFFHSYKNDDNGYIINRNEKIKTLSFTFIELSLRTEAVMSYFNFSTNTVVNKNLLLQSKFMESVLPAAVE